MKSLTKNSIYNIIYKCANILFPLLITAHASRILMADGIGKVSSAQNIATYFAIFAALGLPTYGIKLIASVRNNKNKQDAAFTELFIINAVSTLFFTFAYCALILCIPYFQERIDLSIVCGLAVLFNIINIDWFYQGREEYGYITLRSIIIKIISLIAVYAFVRNANDFVAYAAILTLSKVANNVFNIIHARRYVRLTFKNIRVKKHLKPIFLLLAASLAIEIYTLADTTMLTFVHGDAIVGYYSTARKSIDVARALVIALCAVLLPRLSYLYSNNKKNEFNSLANKGIKVLLYASIPTAIGVILTAKDFVPIIFGDGYEGAVLATQILSVSIISVAFSNFFGNQILITTNEEKEMLKSTIVGAVINILLNLLLIYQYAQNGVAVASVITEICVTIYQFIVVKKCVKLENYKSVISSIVAGSLGMTAIVILINLTNMNSIFKLSLQVLLGASAYLAITLLLKNSIAISIKNKARQLLRIK